MSSRRAPTDAAGLRCVISSSGHSLPLSRTTKLRWKRSSLAPMARHAARYLKLERRGWRLRDGIGGGLA